MHQTFVSLAYKNHAESIKPGLIDTGLLLDNVVSDINYRFQEFTSDLKSDFNIMLGHEIHNKRFKNANVQL